MFHFFWGVEWLFEGVCMLAGGFWGVGGVEGSWKTCCHAARREKQTWKENIPAFWGVLLILSFLFLKGFTSKPLVTKR